MKAPRPVDFRETLEGDVATLVEAIVATADKRGLAVYAVGGPVRDLLLGIGLRDVDLLVEGEGAIELAEASLTLRTGSPSIEIASPTSAAKSVRKGFWIERPLGVNQRAVVIFR